MFENQQLTYFELNTHANQMAHYLQEHGVGPEVLVGLCVERSLEMIIGLLGILKAGGAYVPIDPSFPRERIDYILQDANITVCLTQQSLATLLSERVKQALILDNDALFKFNPITNPLGVVQPLNAAYVLYTSRSTGLPKGVVLPQTALVNLSHWQEKMYQQQCWN